MRRSVQGMETVTPSISRAAIRKPAMRITQMLPTVAFMIPPMRGPAAAPSCSVASPSTYARARIVTALKPTVMVASSDEHTPDLQSPP